MEEAFRIGHWDLGIGHLLVIGAWSLGLSAQVAFLHPLRHPSARPKLGSCSRRSPMPKQWRCAVVGVSVVGKIHVKVLDHLQSTTLAACCDLIPDRAQSILAEQGVSGVPVYKDLGEMLAKEKLDVIHLATPSGLHMEP